MKTVANILAKKKPRNNMVAANAPVTDVLLLMKTYDLSYMVVLKDELYAGIFSERDYAQKVLLMNRPSATTCVEDVMSINLPTVSPDDCIENCMMLMNAFKTRYLPVFDNFKFKDVITMNDLMLSSMSNQHEAMVGYSNEKIF